ncbi:CaiB/BaiF CoA-transferase family protein [uncultured Parasphingorhabdus sp.]|uniref:CaiB/BaiF CoA transferase family protein n=1 Tax=uncultured Parasphingorhabdus sp. TaxID=2709694 RepID=UPI002AA7D856|nr:CaiB/BaiF CoA-transferase family protein [uncultured Parasphingorhabdus sp.]
MNQDLVGITVVSVEQAVAAPYVSSRLADAGARVIKVERPEGDFARDYDNLVCGESAYFVWLNRGKESICLDLRRSGDAAILENMVAQADIFIQNLKSGSLGKLGFHPKELRERYPSLICCSISGFGSDGPRAHLKAYDLIVQAEAGLCSITGTEDGPSRVGVSVCDIAAGMNAHAAILQALFARERTKRGRLIEISLFDALADWMNVPFLQEIYGGRETKRIGVNHASLSPYGAYGCRDGVTLVFSVQNAREWISFCDVFLGRPEVAMDDLYATNMARLQNREALDTLISARFFSLDAEEAIRLLEQSGIAYGRLNKISDLAEHPHLRRSAIKMDAETIDIISPAPVIDGTRITLGRVPKKDEHGLSLRDEFGKT